MDTQKELQERIDCRETELKEIEIEINEKICELRTLQKNQRYIQDELAAIRDARGGIYDKWYRHHRDDNSAYDTIWELEQQTMMLEGYEGEFRIVEG